MAENLQKDFDIDAKSGMRDPSVASALLLYRNARLVRDEEESEWEQVADMYTKTFEAGGLTQQVHSKLIFQAHNAIVKRMKRPERRFISDKLDRISIEILRDGISSVQDWGGITEALISDWGAYHKFLLFGNAFVMMGSGEENRPVTYQNLSLMNVYLDPYATTMRNPAGESDVGEILVIFEYEYDEAKALYPNKKFFPGKIPISQDIGTELHYTTQQEQEISKRVVQVAHYYNIKDKDKPVHTVFAGSAATVLEKNDGDKYMFRHRGEPFIPVLHFKCFPQPSGFYAKGVGHLLYDLAVVEQKLDNMAIAHVEDNVYPVTVLNGQSGKTKQFLNDIYAARELKALGEKAYVINEVPQTGSGFNVQTLRSEPLTAEYERIKQDIVTKVKRCGFPIDEIDRPASETATSTVAETAALTSFVQQIQEGNTETYRDLDMFTMDIIKDTVKTDNDTTIYTTAKLPSGNKITARLDEGVTLGDIADLLENVDVTVDVVSRSGAHKDPIIAKMEMNEILQYSQGTPIQAQLVAERLRMGGFRVGEQDLTQQNDGLEQIAQGAESEAEGSDVIGEAGGVSGVSNVLGGVR